MDAYIAKVDPALAPVMRAARATIRRAAPRLQESICMGMPHWRGEAWVCYLADYSEHVNLGFYQGALLKPRALLEGTGKRLRHVKLRTPADARRPAVGALVHEAAALDARAAPKRAMKRKV